MQIFISDGYIKTGVIDEVDGLNERVVFKYRPYSYADSQVVLERLNKLNGKEAVWFVASETASKIVSWNITDENGVEVAPTKENIQLLIRPIAQALFDIIIGSQPSGTLTEEEKKGSVNVEEESKN